MSREFSSSTSKSSRRLDKSRCIKVIYQPQMLLPVKLFKPCPGVRQAAPSRSDGSGRSGPSERPDETNGQNRDGVYSLKINVPAPDLEAFLGINQL
ncbi:hypothetical protein Q7C36_013931 [Tachysurus vachellii]|uniref:Uncharacterized protein n=1 Tax=Tachysurus vachellii TaxID=175792 RepID=A0AA88SMZ0_TACVA|nr:hypothetical protein Q7C36_013931 [Tachysurus vachellii]